MNPEYLIIAAAVLAALLFIVGRHFWRRRPVGDGWRIGPRINGKNYSKGLPEKPAAMGAGGWQVQVEPGDDIHYVTRDCDRLPAGGLIRAWLDIRGDELTKLWPNEVPTREPIVSLFFQRAGDDWSAQGKYASYRWYSQATWKLQPNNSLLLEARLTFDQWIAVLHGGRTEAGFIDALRNAERVGMTFGHSGGRGHGVTVDKALFFECDRFEILQAGSVA